MLGMTLQKETKGVSKEKSPQYSRQNNKPNKSEIGLDTSQEFMKSDGFKKLTHWRPWKEKRY